jgi:hypothetical protein
MWGGGGGGGDSLGGRGGECSREECRSKAGKGGRPTELVGATTVV